MDILLRWLKANSVMLSNAVSLMGTTAVTSSLGFVYWWITARRFPTEAVGIASASVSAMTLIGGLCVLGLGTLLITELPRQPGHEGELISTALIVVGGVGEGIGIVFALVASYISPGFRPLGASILDVVIFATGVSLTAVTLVLDQALVGLLRGSLQLWRNVLFAFTKLAAVFVVSLLLPGKGGITIYATWALGNFLSLVALVGFVLFRTGWPGRKYLPQWRLLRKLGFAALQHHLLNLALQASVLLLPVIVTTLLSSTMNAWFYVALMIAGFVFLIPSALTIVLHAMNSAQQSTLSHKARVTIGLSFLAGLLTNCLLQLTAEQVLGIFGSSYVGAAWCLRVLLLAVFPLTIRNHYISICRIQDRVVQAMIAILPGTLLEVVSAILGAHFGGLTGLSGGWVAAIFIEALFMLRTVYKTIFQLERSVLSGEMEYAGPQAFWQLDTLPLPTFTQGYAGRQASWLMDTMPLPMIGLSYMTVEAPWLINTSLLPIVRLPVGQTDRERRQSGPSSLDGVSQHHNSRRPRLRPYQLKPYIPYPDDIKDNRFDCKQPVP